MKKIIGYLLSLWLIIGLNFAAAEKALAQVAQNGNGPETTDSLVTKSGETPGYVRGITSGRARSIVAGVLGLISIIIAWRAKTRSHKTAAKAAVATGLVSIVLSVIHLSTSAGAVFGSGSGKAGAIVALILGLSGILLGGMALRLRKTG